MDDSSTSKDPDNNHLVWQELPIPGEKDITEAGFGGAKSELPAITQPRSMPDQHIPVPERSAIADAKRLMELTQELNSLIPPTVDSLEIRRHELAGRPQLGLKTLYDTLIGTEKRVTFEVIETDKIVGRTFESPEGWAEENESRKGRIAQLAHEMAQHADDPTALEHIFHLNKPNERIQVAEIMGPAGPFYHVSDGQHRVSAAMLAGIEKIPAQVRSVEYPIETNVAANDSIRLADWQRLIALGLIDGEIQDYTSENGEQMKRLVVQSEVLPWIRAPQPDLLKISRVYEQLYPGSLDQLAIPRAALIDPIANNFYMSGRWNEYEAFGK